MMAEEPMAAAIAAGRSLDATARTMLREVGFEPEPGVLSVCEVGRILRLKGLRVSISVTAVAKHEAEIDALYARLRNCTDDAEAACLLGQLRKLQDEEAVRMQLAADVRDAPRREAFARADELLKERK